MCGIVGFIGSQVDQKIVLQKMMDAIAHRGPDGRGTYFDEKAALGHLRLSIIDLKGGTQQIGRASCRERV